MIPYLESSLGALLFCETWASQVGDCDQILLRLGVGLPRAIVWCVPPPVNSKVYGPRCRQDIVRSKEMGEIQRFASVFLMDVR